MREPIVRVRDVGDRALASYDIYAADPATGTLSASAAVRAPLRADGHIRSMFRRSFFRGSMSLRTSGNFWRRSMFKGSFFSPPRYVRVPAGTAYKSGRYEFGASHVDKFGTTSGAPAAAALLIISRPLAPTSISQAATANVTLTLTE